MKLAVNVFVVRVLMTVCLSLNVACAAESGSDIAATPSAPAQRQGGALAPGEERLVQVLERRVETGLTLEGLLVKNRYRQEDYQANYDVQIPYQTTEDYYEDIPYQTTEDYYENVPYTEREEYIDREERCENQQRCSNEPRESCSYENVCHSVPDRQCRQERLCRPVPGEQRCENVEECGTNAHGERICKTRKVCENGPSREDCDYVERCENNSRQECRQERQCHTTTERECRNDRVCHSVPVTRYRDVTKYREELRTRTVTKYRQELRTREVTKYRTETRCCVTKQRDVLDHQDSLTVILQIPANSSLVAGELEKFQISLKDNNGILDVELKVVSKITNYKVIDKVIQGGIATLTLEEVPVTVDTGPMGASSVTGLKLKILADETGVVVFKDDGQKGRAQTTYEILVQDGAGVEEFRSVVTADGNSDQKHSLGTKLSLKKVHVLTVTVNRQGPGMAPIQFVKTFKRSIN